MEVSRLMASAVTWRPRAAQGPSGADEATNTAVKSADAQGKLSAEQQEQLTKLKARDADVRQHEQAHQAAGGPYAGSISFTYQQGPDGKRYAVGGEVPIDTSPERTPQETIRKMEVVKRAALSPTDPSSQDARVAAMAEMQGLQAQQKLNTQAADGSVKTDSAKVDNSAKTDSLAKQDGVTVADKQQGVSASGGGAPSAVGYGLAAYAIAAQLGVATKMPTMSLVA